MKKELGSACSKYGSERHTRTFSHKNVMEKAIYET
jgi:hypothetical protein